MGNAKGLVKMRWMLLGVLVGCRSMNLVVAWKQRSLAAKSSSKPKRWSFELLRFFEHHSYSTTKSRSFV